MILTTNIQKSSTLFQLLTFFEMSKIDFHTKTNVKITIKNVPSPSPCHAESIEKVETDQRPSDCVHRLIFQISKV